MAVLPIRITGEPVLHAPAEPIGQIDDRIRTLVADMIETMHAAPGVGLAGPQVGEALRLFVYAWTDADDVDHAGVAINPQLWISPATPQALDELDPDSESEGCLSIPGEREPLRRADRALLRATDLDGEEYEIEAEGWLARIFQHEYDHLDGILYADRLELPYQKSIGKVIRRKAWGIPGRAWTPGVDQIEP